MRIQLWGLFERGGSGWVRLAPAIAKPKSAAVRVFQDALLAHSLSGGAVPERRLMPVACEIGWSYLAERRRTVYPAWRFVESW